MDFGADPTGRVDQPERNAGLDDAVIEEPVEIPGQPLVEIGLDDPAVEQVAGTALNCVPACEL